MKVSVFVKILIVFFVITLSFIYFFFKYMKSIEHEIVKNSEKVLTHGLLRNLKKEIQKAPKNKWPTIINKTNNKNLSIQDIKSLSLSNVQKDALDKGEVVVTTSPLIQFLNEVTASRKAYIKIENTAFALSYWFSNPVDLVSKYMKPIMQNISSNISSVDKTKRAQTMSMLEKVYGYPIHLIKTNKAKLPLEILLELKRNGIAYKLNKNTTQIGIVYYPFGDEVLKIGPIKYLAITARISDIIEYFIVAFFLFCFLSIGGLSALFIRNLKKIYHITEHFSEGDFNYKKHVSMSSVLHGLYLNITTMGKKLNELIESNKKMCRFIAHEIRTPLSTIQMATDRLRKKRCDDKLVLNQIESIQEDVVDMNCIVSTFLIYSKMLSTDFQLHKENLNVVSWVERVIKPFISSKFQIKFSHTINDSFHMEFDKQVLKHALTNLISNAIKFAKSQILILVNMDKRKIYIHVHDDGPGLPVDNAHLLFNEYATAVDIDSADKHIGLGLAIVKKVVLLHSGCVSVDKSQELGGAKFTISLPLQTDANTLP